MDTNQLVVTNFENPSKQNKSVGDKTSKMVCKL